MTAVTYKASYESVKNACIKGTIIGTLIGWLITAMQYSEGVQSTLGLGITFGLTAIFFGLVFFFADSSIRNYELKISEDGISRMNYKGTFNYQLKWAEIDLIVIGEVMENYNRWESWFQGMEIHNHSDNGYAYKTIYKLEHIENKEDYIKALIELCESKGIQYNDIRKEDHTR